MNGMKWYVPAMFGMLILASCTKDNGVKHYPIIPDNVTKVQNPANLNDEELWQWCMNESLKSMPVGGDYRTNAMAGRNFVSAFDWDSSNGKVRLHPNRATPSFCSIACYLILCDSLQRWEKYRSCRLPSKAWLAMLPKRGQADGDGTWGWANANGPGFAVMVHQLNAGKNFTSWAQAKPGDFMKMFWTDELGRREFGHLTVFLKDHGDKVTFWSSNTNGPGAYVEGYGVKTVPKSSIKRVIFTRITHPQGFAQADSLGFNQWLHSLLKKSVSPASVYKASGISR